MPKNRVRKLKILVEKILKRNRVPLLGLGESSCSKKSVIFFSMVINKTKTKNYLANVHLNADCLRKI